MLFVVLESVLQAVSFDWAYLTVKFCSRYILATSGRVEIFGIPPFLWLPLADGIFTPNGDVFKTDCIHYPLR
jgi:hypothetical protein